MKVRSVEPGTVRNVAVAGQWHWTATVKINERLVELQLQCASANEAKQAMREYVARERKRHGLFK